MQSTKCTFGTIKKDSMEAVIPGLDTAKKLGLLEEEYDKVCEILDRKPNFTELSIYSVMWSEHCSYKNSIKWLKTLPRKGPHLLAEAGEENAGLVDIGDGLACAFKIESHNHPSAIEPYQGAATGVGGINRDIFTMGARPVAQLNSLRFGSIDEERTKWLLKGVVKGIGDYGNSFGVPVLGGEVHFDPCYQTNPLVNAMSVGILDIDKTISAISYGEGNPVFIVGSRTGKDGIHGATFASGDITESSSDDLPAVQVGDPFQEKLLLEASLELAETDVIVGMQDMGAAGIICSSAEMSEKGGHGMDIWLDKVPTRQAGMEPFEILLSESQERMLVVVKKGEEDIVTGIFDKWDLQAEEIGIVTTGDTLRFFDQGELVAKVPAESLVLGGGAPVYDPEYSEPAYFAETKKFKIEDIAEPTDLVSIAKFLTTHPNIASKKWVTDQYDSMVGIINMTTNRPSDAGLVNVKGSNKALALTVDCNARYVQADPRKGCSIAVAEAARNIACTGAKGSGVTNCLNFGNPYNPEVYWSFVGSIKGMSDACLTFETPVTGGNVSFYNQTVTADSEEAVFPTPTIGMMGILEDKSKAMGSDFQHAGDSIYLMGESRNDINSSEYLYSHHGVKLSTAPYLNLAEELKLHTVLREAINQNLIESAHDCADGGLFITLLESAMNHDLGFEVEYDSSVRKDAFLFGEAQGRVVVSVHARGEQKFEEFLNGQEQNFSKLGTTNQSGELILGDENFGNMKDYKERFMNSLEERLLS